VYGVAHHTTHHHTRRRHLFISLGSRGNSQAKGAQGRPSLECIGASALPPTTAYYCLLLLLPTALMLMMLFAVAAMEVEDVCVAEGG